MKAILLFAVIMRPHWENYPPPSSCVPPDILRNWRSATDHSLYVPCRNTFMGGEAGRMQVYVCCKFKESLIVIQMVQTLHTSANILHVCIHKNELTMFQEKLHLLFNSE